MPPGRPNVNFRSVRRERKPPLLAASEFPPPSRRRAVTAGVDRDSNVLFGREATTSSEGRIVSGNDFAGAGEATTMATTTAANGNGAAVGTPHHAAAAAAAAAGDSTAMTTTGNRLDVTMTPYSGIIQKYVDENRRWRRSWRDHQSSRSRSLGGEDHESRGGGSSGRIRRQVADPIFGTSNIVDAELMRRHRLVHGHHPHGGEGGGIGGIRWKKCAKLLWKRGWWQGNDVDADRGRLSRLRTKLRTGREVLHQRLVKHQRFLRVLLLLALALSSKFASKKYASSPFLQKFKRGGGKDKGIRDATYPEFVYNHPYVTSSYYTATSSIGTIEKMYEIQVEPKKDRLPDRERGIVSRLAILRPFCEFDADALPTTFACWNSLVPCRAAEMDLGDEADAEEDEWVLFDMRANGNGRKLEEGEEDQWECDADYDGANETTSWFRGAVKSLFKRCRRKPRTKDFFDDVSADGLRTTSADLFLFYSQTFSDNDVAMKSVDKIMDEFFSPGGWSRCFDNIYAVEANIPKELDLYIPAAQEELYNWVNGPNRQYEAGFRIIQSGEWGDYDGFYLMEGDSVPVKNYWLDVILGEINAYRPFAVLGAQYDGDKWDAFYEDIPISLLHHTNGNGIYNTSHPLLERLTGQLEVEAPCPYNSIPYDYRMSQMWVEGTLGIVPKLAPKIMLNEEGENITLSDNKAMFSKWANRWKDEEPYRFTKAIHNYAATNLIPRHLGPEYVIHGAKLYSPWDPARTEITLVIMEWFFDRSLNLISKLDSKDHPFSKVIIMIPPSVSNNHDYTQYTSVPVTLQFRDKPDVMDLCTADVQTEWFMITNSYHQVSRHVDLMFTPGKFVPVVPFTPATYPFCLKYPYCKEIIMLAQRWNPTHKQVVLDMDMLYHTKHRNDFCQEWTDRNGEDGSDLYAVHQPLRWKLKEGKIIGPKGPTATDYLAYLAREKLDSKMYKMTDRSLYGARAPFVKVYKKEEKLDGMSEEELARRLGMTLLSNTTECSCDRFETEEECLGSGLGCQWRPLFESCHPPEMIDDGIPICSTTEPPTMSPTLSIMLQETEAPTVEVAESEEDDKEGDDAKNELSLTSLFKTREHEFDTAVEGGDAPEGRRHLLLLRDEKSMPDTLKSFDPISVSDNMNPASSLMESLSRGEVGEAAEEIGVAPTKSPRQGTTETMCPTWGPSVVPRRLGELLSSSEEEDLVHGDNSTEPLNASLNFTAHVNSTSTNLTKHSWPGRARHTQHKLVQLDATKSLDATSVQVPPPDEAKKRRVLVNYGEELGELRLVFDTSLLSKLSRSMGKNFNAVGQYKPTKSRVTAYIDQVFPSIVETWAEVLKIYSLSQNIVVPRTTSPCGETTLIPEKHLTEGVADADVLIYVETRGEDESRTTSSPSSPCSIDSRPQITICHFDQFMRPLIGSLSICLDNMDVQNGKVYKREMLHHTALLSQLVGRFLGLSPRLFRYFRDVETGQLWGERNVNVACGGEDEDDQVVKQEIMLSNIIQKRQVAHNSGGEQFYEISTPTVKQVVRNHFDCQTISGARLAAPTVPTDSNNKTDEPCSFFDLDLRFHFDEDMTSISQNADSAHAVSPLSLALLEDSSWYVANFTAAKTSSFGRGAGCGFIESSCITGGNIPDYSHGYFCNSPELPGARSGCDYAHHNKAGCDLETDTNPPERHRYFSDPKFGAEFDDVHYCPMRSKYLVPCYDGKADASLSWSHSAHHLLQQLTGESFEENSRCFETDANVPVCLETVCNPTDKMLSVVVKGRMFHCAYHGQVVNVDVGYSIVCPRIAAVCPDLVCPSNCSGKGLCDYCKEVPECICDNPSDLTDGCWDS